MLHLKELTQEERDDIMPYKDFCRSNGITVKNFCEVVGIPYQTMMAILRGTRSCRVEEAKRIEEGTFGKIKKEWCLFPRLYQDHKHVMNKINSDPF